jgi:hypothetical protein
MSIDLTNAIADAVKNPAICKYCDTVLTAEELKNHLEVGVPIEEYMCDKCAESTAPETAAPVVDKTRDLEAELAKLKAENVALKATAPKPAPAKPEKPAAQPAAQTAKPAPHNSTALDKLLLSLIAKFKTTKPEFVKPGRPVGTFAVKVHGYLHACKVPETAIRTAIADAVKRNVISQMSIPTKLSIKGIWSAVGEDEEASQEIAKQKGIRNDVYRAIKKICDPRQVPVLKEFNSARSTLYNLHRQMTLAWDDKAGRMLPQAIYFDYMTKIGEAKQRVIEKYDAFLAQLPAIEEVPERSGYCRRLPQRGLA